MLKADSVRQLVSFVLEQKKMSGEEISIHFVTGRKISKIHLEFFNDPAETDCMTFPLDEQFLGEIFICPKVALQYDPENPYLETTLYIIHCILHIYGYTDYETNDRKKMEKEQNRILKKVIEHNLHLKNPVCIK